MGNAARTPAKESSAADNEQATQDESQGDFVTGLDGKERPTRIGAVFRIIYVILSIIIILECIAVIAVTVSTAIATKSFSIQQSGRLVAMIILALTAAITLSVVIYAMMGIFRKKTRPLHTTGVVLVILVLIQAIICGASVNLTTYDEIQLSRSLADSYNLSREDNTRHVKLWTMTQSDLNCCGVYGPEDYRTPGLPLYFPPNVPISCCPTYDPGRSELLQEREREGCKARREYYDLGCQTPVVQLFKDTAKLVLGVTILLIIFEVLITIVGIVINRLHKKHKQKHKQSTDVQVQSQKVQDDVTAK